MHDPSHQNEPIGLFKRLMVIVYDLLLLIAVLMMTGIPVAAIMTFVLNDGNAITEDHPFYVTSQFIILSILLCVSLLFYGWFWTHKGQTLGMKTWRVQLVTSDSDPLDWNKVTIRFLVALLSWSIFGLGFIWSLFDKEKRTWHDILSATKLIQLPKK